MSWWLRRVSKAYRRSLSYCVSDKRSVRDLARGSREAGAGCAAVCVWVTGWATEAGGAAGAIGVGAFTAACRFACMSRAGLSPRCVMASGREAPLVWIRPSREGTFLLAIGDLLFDVSAC